MSDDQGPVGRTTNAERAYRLFAQAAHDLESAGSLSARQLAERLRGVSERVLGLLGDEEYAGNADGEELMSRLERQSREIADDLRRVERLMKHHPSDDE